jgi:DNA (cytosine-5)-methyltransferase 1
LFSSYYAKNSNQLCTHWTLNGSFANMHNMPTDRNIISLFSGAMGLDLGLESAGFKTAVVVEINRYAKETIKLNRPKLPIIPHPIEEVSSQELLDSAGLKAGEVTVVSGGPCCQSFSTVGKRESIAGSRGNLFRHFTRIVEETKPRFFVMENVKGILSAAVKHRRLNDRGPGNPPLQPDEELGSALRVIRKELGDLGYYVIFGLLNCADYGVPQKRLRVIFIGSRDGEDIELPAPTHAQEPENGIPRWITLRDAIGDLEDPNPEYVGFSEKSRQLLATLKAGQNWSALLPRLQKQALGEAYQSWGGRSGFCRRLRWDKPAPTLTTSPVGRATTLCHPTRLRPLTTREYAVLQQFPDDWQFAGSATQKYIQIGNAVPTGLGRAIGMMLRAVMKKTNQEGLPAEAARRKGLVVCADPVLEKRIKKQPRTQLHPPRLLKSADPVKIRQWLNAGSSQNLLFEKD